MTQLNINKKIIASLCTVTVLFLAFSGSGFAMPTSNLEQEDGGQVGYSVQKMSRDNTEAAYFDLYVKPNDKKVLKARIFNETDKPMTIKMSIFTASTSNKVQIVYTKKSPKNDDSMQYYMEDLVKIKAENDEVTVPANGQVDVEAEVTIPKEISGVLLGSWYFEKKVEEDEGDNETGGVNINNQYSYAMAIRLEASQISNPNINLLDVKAGMDNYRRAIISTVQNDRPAMMSEVTISTTVKEKGESEVLYETEESNLKIAPNTTFEHITLTEGDLLKAGNYILEMNVKTNNSKLSKTEWNLKQEFKITDKEVAQLNKEAINEENSQLSSWMIIAIIAVCLIVVALVVWLFIRRKSKNKPERRKRR